MSERIDKEALMTPIREVLKTLTGPIDKEHYNSGSGRAIADCDAVSLRILDAILPEIEKLLPPEEAVLLRKTTYGEVTDGRWQKTWKPLFDDRHEVYVEWTP